MSVGRARNLRKNMTDAEHEIWFRLRDRRLKGAKFRRQYSIGPYVVDFVCVEQLLVVEIDGGQHGERHEQDEKRTQFLMNRGYKVVRFWNNDVLQNIDGVPHEIASHFPECGTTTPHPCPLPLEGAREIFGSPSPSGRGSG